MYELLIRHKVGDYETFKKIFLEDEERRRSTGSMWAPPRLPIEVLKNNTFMLQNGHCLVNAQNVPPCKSMKTFHPLMTGQSRLRHKINKIKHVFDPNDAGDDT